MPSSSGKRRATALALRGARLAGHVLVAGLVLELAARLDDHVAYDAPMWGTYDADVLRSEDAEGVVRNVPDARFEKWRINHLGFRGEPVAGEKPAGRRRIACLGTSESFGLYENQGYEWPAQLGRLMSAKHPDSEVLNASVVGLRPDARQRYVEKYVLPLHPDILILYLNVMSDATLRTSQSERDGAMRDGGSAPSTSSSSRALTKLRRSFKAAVPEPIWNAVRVWRLARSLRLREIGALGDHAPLDVIRPEAVAAFERHLRGIVLAERERGVAPILATYPTLGAPENRQRYRLEFLETRWWHIELSDAGLIDAASKLNDAVRRVATELKVPLADVDVAVPKTSEYFKDFQHYSDAGAALVARTVLGTLEQSGLLDRLPSVSAGGADGPGQAGGAKSLPAHTTENK